MAGNDNNTGVLLPLNSEFGFSDISGRSHDAVNTASTLIVTDIADPFGNFDGVAKCGANQYLYIPSTPDAQVMENTVGIRSFDFWIRGDATTTQTDYCAFYGNQPGAQYITTFAFRGIGNVIRSMNLFAYAYWGYHSFSNTFAVDPDNLYDGNWHHIAFIFHDNIYQAYYDGDRFARRGFSWVAVNPATVYIGRNPNTNTPGRWSNVWLSNYRIQHSNYFNITDDELTINVPDEKYSGPGYSPKRYRNQSVIIT